MAQKPAAHGSKRRRLLVIRNRHAGLKSARLVGRVADELLARGCDVRIVETQSADEVQELLAKPLEVDAIVAAGGDGTIRALALAMIEQDIALPLGIIPAGTGNVLAHEIGLPRDPAQLAEILITAGTRAAHIMTANGTPFLLMAACGFDAEVLLKLSMKLKQQVGRGAYALPTLATLAKGRAHEFKVELDGAPHAATWAIVANARNYGGSFQLVRDASVFDDTLHAVLFSAKTRAGRLAELLWLAAGRVERARGVKIVTCRHAIIHAPAWMPCQADGDSIGFGPLEIARSGSTVPLIAPADGR